MLHVSEETSTGGSADPLVLHQRDIPWTIFGLSVASIYAPAAVLTSLAAGVDVPAFVLATMVAVTVLLNVGAHLISRRVPTSTRTITDPELLLEHSWNVRALERLGSRPDGASLVRSVQHSSRELLWKLADDELAPDDSRALRDDYLTLCRLSDAAETLREWPQLWKDEPGSAPFLLWTHAAQVSNPKSYAARQMPRPIRA